MNNKIIIYSILGCQIMFYPSAYDYSVGELFDFTFRARGYDNEQFALAISPARNESGKHRAYGYSYVADPMGHIVKKAGQNEEILCVDLGIAQ